MAESTEKPMRPVRSEDDRVIEIRADGQSYFCKAQMLIDNSKYFECILTNDTLENASGRVELTLERWALEACTFLAMFSRGFSLFKALAPESLFADMYGRTILAAQSRFLRLARVSGSLTFVCCEELRASRVYLLNIW